jgi:hypothetical protein
VVVVTGAWAAVEVVVVVVVVDVSGAALVLAAWAMPVFSRSENAAAETR